MNFTGHNILLDNKKKTKSDQEILLAESALWTSIKKTIELVLPATTTDYTKMRTVDLGCLEGGYSVEFARLGFNSLGIEAREENLKKCNYVKSNLNLPHLNFAQDDVRNLAKYGTFDITFCSGLLYHLHDPVAFLKLLGNCTTKILILNTHCATENDMRYHLGFVNNLLIAPFQKRFKSFAPKHNYRLSSLTTNENYRGRWYHEWKENSSNLKINQMLWASYNNSKSFWLCKQDLVEVLYAAGFDNVFEQFDFTGDVLPQNYIHTNDRHMFIAIKK